MRNSWCYKHFINKTKPKNIFKRIYYKIWLMCGVSPSGLCSLSFYEEGEQQYMKDRVKEIEYLIYLKSELIKQTKKEIKQLQQEKDTIYGYKKLERTNQKNGK